MAEVKMSLLLWNQYTDWPSLREAGIKADHLGYTSLLTWVQVPSLTPHSNPMAAMRSDGLDA